MLELNFNLPGRCVEVGKVLGAGFLFGVGFHLQEPSKPALLVSLLGATALESCLLVSRERATGVVRGPGAQGPQLPRVCQGRASRPEISLNPV